VKHRASALASSAFSAAKQDAMGFGKLIGITIAPRSEDRHYTDRMARTHTKVRFLPKGKQKHTEASAAKGVEAVLRILEGR